jgi:hypothetical protein
MKSMTAFIVGLVLATPLAAQSIIPRERPATVDKIGALTDDDVRKVMDQFSACVLDRRRKRVLQALALPPDSPEQNKLFAGLAKTECTAYTQLHFGGPSFRSSLYKALVRKDFGREVVFAAPSGGASSATNAQPRSGTFLDETEPLKFASCIIRSDPEHARDAILSTAGSDNEEAALGALAKLHGQCLYKGETLSLSKGRLIGLLAEAYYRDASAEAEMSAAK